MNILSIGQYPIAPTPGSDLTSGISDRTAPDRQGYTAGSAPAAEESYTAVTFQFSPAAVIYGRLQNLSETDPGKFKKVTGEMSDALKDEANNSKGAQAKAYSQLSREFAAASRTGKMTALTPADIATAINIPGAESSGNDGTLPTAVAQVIIHSITVPADDSNTEAQTDPDRLAGMFRSA
jgi:hypothetical protein